MCVAQKQILTVPMPSNENTDCPKKRAISEILPTIGNLVGFDAIGITCARMPVSPNKARKLAIIDMYEMNRRWSM